MQLFARLDAARERWNVLRHPFYVRWSAGELDRDELAFYAGEYRHAVVAVAEQTDTCARMAPELDEHAAEERAHIDLWDEFAAALDAPTDRPALPETLSCARAWTGGESLAERLAVLYAVEASQPAIARTKLDGLVAHYGMRGGEPATAYFELHAERDHEHAAESRRLIEARNGVDADRLVHLAAGALQANWRLLDGVEMRSTSSTTHGDAVAAKGKE